jgi:thiosulfate dehydrogenase
MTTIRTLLPALLGGALLFGQTAQATEPANQIITAPAASQKDETLIKGGKYVVLLGDCIACHTADKGAAMAGGRALLTPFGTVYSTNITPDEQTGIGKYTFEQFDRAMRHGVAADGHNLYPAMPYPSYAKISGEDMRALYAYLKHGLAPVKQANKPADMNWPFSMRWGLSLWNLAFLDATPFKSDAAKDAAWNRGAYLVQGLGHCGSCHSPRGIAFQEKAMGEAGANGKYFLAGQTIEAWRALSLRNLWTVEDTALLLKTGQNRFGTISGSMVEVIHRSTQHFTDADLTAIATYLKSPQPGENDLPIPAVPTRVAASNVPASIFTTRGGLGYVQFCVDCHRQDGAGVSRLFPPLSLNQTITDADPATLLHVTLTGWKTAETAAHPRVYTMPAFAPLSDQELAEVLTFVRTSWGNHAKPVAASDVAKMRDELDPKITDSSKFETPRLADMLASPNAEQLVRGMRLHLETRTLLPNNVGNSLNCTSCHLNVGTVADGSPFVGVSAFFPSYAPTRRASHHHGGPHQRLLLALDERQGAAGRFGGYESHGRLLRLDEERNQAAGQGRRARGRHHKQGDPTERGKWQRGLREAMRRMPRQGRRRLERCRRARRLPAAVGRQLVQHRRRHGADLYSGCLRQAQHANRLPGEVPAGARRLSDQEAVDVAEYFSHQLRPDFPPKVNDWPKDKKPADARY